MSKTCFSTAAAFLVVLFLSASAPAQNLSGTVSGTGKITIDNAVAQNGATVGNGSVIATAADADATVDFGALGKLVMRPNTTIRLAAIAGGLQMTMELCGSVTQTVPQGVISQLIISPAKKVEVVVSRGEVSLDQENGDHKSLSSRKERVLFKVTNVGVNNAGAETVFTVSCCQGNYLDKVNR